MGTILAFTMQFLKKMAGKYGIELTKGGIYISLFLVAIIYSTLSYMGVFSTEYYITIVTVMTNAIGVYELAIKGLPALLNNIK